MRWCVFRLNFHQRVVGTKAGGIVGGMAERTDEMRLVSERGKEKTQGEIEDGLN